MKAIRTTLCLLALFPLAACGGTGSANDNDGDTAVDSADTADQTSALSSVVTDPVDATVTTSDGAAMVSATNSGRFLMPAGCLNATAVGNVVTYKFNDCTGPYGLVKMKGTVTGTYTMQGVNSFQVVLASSDLTLNNAKVTLASTSVISGPPNNRIVTVTSSTKAVTARGKSIEHSGNYSAKWDGMCVSLDGAFTTRVGLLSWATTIAGYRRCVGTCPTSGLVTIVAGNRSVSASFSGAASAQVTGSDGRIVTVPLFCTASL